MMPFSRPLRHQLHVTGLRVVARCRVFQRDHAILRFREDTSSPGSLTRSFAIVANARCRDADERDPCPYDMPPKTLQATLSMLTELLRSRRARGSVAVG